jgi:SH3-like domain-containing protein
MSKTVSTFLAALVLSLGVLLPGDAAEARTMVAVDRPEINMRDGPGTNHQAMWMLIRGYPLEVIGRKGKWYHVRDFENDKGWVYRSLTSSKKPHHIVRVKVANIRKGPGTSTRVVGKAAYGEVLRTLDRRGSWVKIRQEGGLVGWISRNLLWGW